MNERDREVLLRAVHDLRNPLAVLRSMIEYLDSELAARGGDVADALKDGDVAARRLVTILEDMELLGTLDAGSLHREKASLATLLGSATKTPFENRVPATVVLDVDADLLRRAFGALLDLLGRAAPPGASLVAERGADGAIVLTAGSPAADAPPYVATSLVLDLAARIVEAHGGALTTSADDSGHRYVITLP
jgi:signal transduction histidine kinase